MDWNKTALLAAQCVVVIVLGVCVAMGHNSTITDGLMAVSGSIVGGGLITAIAKKK